MNQGMNQFIMTFYILFSLCSVCFIFLKRVTMLRSPFLAHKLFINTLLKTFGPISFSSLIRDPALKDTLAYLAMFHFLSQFTFCFSILCSYCIKKLSLLFFCPHPTPKLQDLPSSRLQNPSIDKFSKQRENSPVFSALHPAQWPSEAGTTKGNDIL